MAPCRLELGQSAPHRERGSRRFRSRAMFVSFLAGLALGFLGGGAAVLLVVYAWIAAEFDRILK